MGGKHIKRGIEINDEYRSIKSSMKTMTSALMPAFTGFSMAEDWSRDGRECR